MIEINPLITRAVFLLIIALIIAYFIHKHVDPDKLKAFFKRKFSNAHIRVIAEKLPTATKPNNDIYRDLMLDFTSKFKSFYEKSHNFND